MHMSTLRRQTGLLKVPMIIELIKAELESFEKIIVFGQYLDTIGAIAAGLGQSRQ